MTTEKQTYARIGNFVSIAKRKIELVSSFQGDSEINIDGSESSMRDANFKKILFLAILDSLAKIRYRGEKFGNKKRFTQLLRDHSGWIEIDLVSLPILSLRLAKYKTKRRSPLVEH